MGKAIEPGFYPDVSYDEYASWDAVNHTKLSGFLNTPAHARWLFLNDKPPTPAKEFGWLSHIAILEPHRLDAELAVRPDVDGRTKEGKPILEAFKEKMKPGGEYAGRKMVTEEDRDRLRNIVTNVYQHETAREYLTGPGHNEVSIAWIDQETSLPCKARLDRVAVVSKMPGVTFAPSSSQFMIVIDVKNIGEPASLRNVERAIFNYNYASQAAMYLEGLQAIYPADEMRPFVWIVPEMDPPHLVRLFTPNPDLLEWGRQRWHNWLRQYAECKRSGNWPGWDSGIEEASLPPWAAKVWEFSQ